MDRSSETDASPLRPVETPPRAALRLARLPPEAPGADLEIFLAVLGGMAWGALLLLPLDRIAPWLGRCRFHELTGVPCVGCGSTRGVLALARGELWQGLASNPLVVSLLLLLLLYAPVAAWLWLSRRPRPRVRIDGTWPRRAAWLVAALLVTGNWVFLIWSGR